MNQNIIATDRHQRAGEWALVLAGGDGTRLKSLTRQVAGDERPKQFCALIGPETLLEQTWRRVHLEFRSDHVLNVLTRAHERFFAPYLAQRSSMKFVIQPGNRGTAPAILYGLLRIASEDPDGIVGLFPSDHFVSEDEEFMVHVRLAMNRARVDPTKIILLGIAPENPESEYGWIEPGERLPGCRNLFRVRRFWEKPDSMRAQVLHLRGCLWNSFVIVAHVRAMLKVIDGRLPELSRLMACLVPSFGFAEELRLAALLYENMESSNFSQSVLERAPECLAVEKVIGVHWNDLGAPARVLASLRQAGQLSPSERCNRAVA